MTFGFDNIAELAGGLAFFLYGIHRVRSGLERASGGGLRAALGFVTKRPLAAAAVGGGLTLVTQSSSAVAVILVGMVGSGLVAFGPSVAILLGADLATTLTVQILAFNVASWSLLGVAAGTLLVLASPSRRVKYAGDVLLGFGMLFFGMHLMKTSAVPLAGNDAFVSMLAATVRHPVLGLLAGTIVTMIIQSSAATIGLVLALMQSGALSTGPAGAPDFAPAIAIVLGANIGTAATGAIAAIGAGRAGRRVAIAQILMKILSVAIVFPFLDRFAALALVVTNWMNGSEARAVANAHTIFNTVRLVVLLPFAGLIARLVLRIYPDRPEGPSRAIRHLTDTKRDSPAIILMKVTRELANMTARVRAVAERAVCSYEGVTLGEVDKFRAADRETDALYLVVVEHLRGIAHGELSGPQTEQLQGLLYVVKDLEQLGDSVSGRIADVLEEKLRADAHFSVEGGLEIKRLGGGLCSEIRAIERALETGDASPLAAVRDAAAGFEKEYRKVERAHFRRCAAGVREAVETDALFTNLVGELSRIDALVYDIMTVLLDIPAVETSRTG